MIDKVKEYRTFQRFVRTLLIIGGCWYMPTKSGKFAYCWPGCMFLAMTMYTMISFHISYILRHNLRSMMKCVGIAITGFGAILKVIIFMINRGSLINYHRTLNDLFEEELMQNEKIRTIILSSLRKVYTLAYTYFATIVTLMLVFLGPPYIFIIRNLLHFHLSTNYTLPHSRGIGHFWTVPNNFLYHLHLFYETGLTILSGMTACGVDSAFGLYVYQFSSTIRAMTFTLMNSPSTEKYSDLLKTCIVKHQKLQRCRDTLEYVYGPIIYWHIVTNAVLLCALIYDIMPLSDFNFKHASMSLAYSAIKLVQTFAYAWYGTFLTNAGEDFRKGIYFGDWPNSSLDCHVKTNVILMMMQKPMTVNAFYSPVDVIMFTNFVNATMSYFFLLQSVGG